jgi:hypothetical protein
MAVPGSGLGSQLMLAEETTWGTPVTVTRAIPHNSASLKFAPKAIQGMGLQAGAYVNLGQTRANATSVVTGDVEHDFTSKQMGLYLKHALGNVVTAQQTSSIAYKHTFTLGSQVNGKGLTIQVGKPTTTATVVPHTYSGCKVTSWELSCANADILKAKFSIIGKSMTTATALATASYPTASNVFFFKQGTFNLNGSPFLALRDFTLAGDNGLADDRYYFGNGGLIDEPIRKDFTKQSIKGTLDYLDTTVESAYLADTEMSCVMQFVGAQIVTGSPNYYETLTITCNGLRLNGDEPPVSGADLLQVGLDADILIPIAGGTPLTIEYTSLDTTP